MDADEQRNRNMQWTGQPNIDWDLVDPMIDGKQMHSISRFANNDPDPEKATQMELDKLKGMGIEPIKDEKYGWLIDDSRYNEAYPDMREFDLFTYGPLFMAAGVAGLALSGAAVAGAGGGAAASAGGAAAMPAIDAGYIASGVGSETALTSGFTAGTAGGTAAGVVGEAAGTVPASYTIPEAVSTAAPSSLTIPEAAAATQTITPELTAAEWLAGSGTPTSFVETIASTVGANAGDTTILAGIQAWAKANPFLAQVLTTTSMQAIGGMGSAMIANSTMEDKIRLELEAKKSLQDFLTQRSTENRYKGKPLVNPREGAKLQRYSGGDVYAKGGGLINSARSA